jgi:hypothetical protein
LNLNKNVNCFTTKYRNITSLPYDESYFVLIFSFLLQPSHWSFSRLFLCKYLNPHLNYPLCLILTWMSKLSEFYWDRLFSNFVHQSLLMFGNFILQCFFLFFELLVLLLLSAFFPKYLIDLAFIEL